MGSLSEKIDVYGSTDDTHSAAPVGAIVRVDGRDKHLVLTESELTISPCKTSSTDITDLSVSITDVIGVQMDLAPKSKGRTDNSTLSETVCMILHYTQHRVKDKTLRPKKVKVWGNRAYLTELGQKIRDFCYKVPGRPWNLVTIINPISGNREGPKIFTEIIEPLFNLAGISNTVITTKQKREAVELVENLDLAEYHGLVLVGGDGLYSEALEGITRQQQRSAGLNIDDIDAELRPVNIPVGIIPTGTGNAVSRWANGITDVKTAVLNVIRGQQQRAQMSKVHSDGAFLRMSGVNIVYGMMSDMIKRSDKLRWMKTKRYPYAMLRMVIGRKRKFHCRVQYRTLADDGLQNGNGSVRTEEVAASSSPSSGGSWRDYDPKGQQFRGLLSFSCVPVDTEEDRAVQTITGSSSHLIIDHGCFAPKFLKYLLNYISPVKTEVTSRKLVVLKDVTAFRIMLTENNEIRPGSCCTSPSKDRELERLSAMDGEVIPLVTPMLDVRVHGGFVPLYGCVNQLQNSNSHGGVKNRAFEPVIED